MLNELIAGAGMIVLTTIIHAAFMALGIKMLNRRKAAHRAYSHSRATWTVALFVLVMFCAAIVEIFSWSTLFRALDAFQAAEPAYYFATVAYTTLGFGDIVLGPEFRLLAAICAANGIIMFGWTTALVFFVVQRVYFQAPPKGDL